MPAANIRLGERKGGLSDVQSLNRELDSLRGYRDVLHDTMKGLVEQAAGRLPAGEFPELASSLDKVAGFLAALVAQGKATSSADADELALALSEAERFRLRAEAAEEQLRSHASVFPEAAARVAAEQLAEAEAALLAAQRQATQQRVARRELEALVSALDCECEGLEAAMVAQAFKEAGERRSAERAHSRALAKVQAALERAEDEADAARQAHAQAADALAATARERISESESRDERLRRLAREAEEAARALAANREAAAALNAEVAKLRTQCQGLEQGLEVTHAENAGLRARIAELERLLNAPAAAPPPPPPVGKSRFAQYVEGLEGAKGRAGSETDGQHAPPRSQSPQMPPQQPPTQPQTQPPTQPTTQPPPPLPPQAQMPQQQQPGSARNGDLRPARERGGALLRQSGTAAATADWKQAAAPMPRPPRSLLPPSKSR